MNLPNVDLTTQSCLLFINFMPISSAACISLSEVFPVYLVFCCSGMQIQIQSGLCDINMEDKLSNYYLSVTILNKTWKARRQNLLVAHNNMLAKTRKVCIPLMGPQTAV